MLLDGFAPPSQPLTTLWVCSQTVFVIFPRQKFWGESNSGSMCQDEPGERQEEVGKGVARHEHPWNKLFYLLEQQWGSRGRGCAGGT